MHPNDWFKVLVVICTVCTFYTCSKSINHKNRLHYSVDKVSASDKPQYENNKNEGIVPARCTDLFGRLHNEHLLKRYLILNERRISPHYVYKCFKYLAHLLVQFNKKPKRTRNVVKRDADSDEMDTANKRKQIETGKKIPENDAPAVNTTITDYGIFIETSLFDPRPGDETDFKSPFMTKATGTKSTDTKGLASWVFIVIGIAAVIVIVVPLTAALIYYKRRLALRHQPVSTKPTGADTSGLMYDTQRSRSTDKGTERSKSTVTSYLSKDSWEAAECYELAPLRSTSARERSSVTEIIQESEYDEEEPVRCHQYNIRRSPPRLKVINTSSEAPSDLYYSRIQDDLRSYERQNDVEGVSSLSVINSRQYDGNRLRDREIDFHRRNVDVDIVYKDINVQRDRHQNQNTSSWDQDSCVRQSSHRIPVLHSPVQGESREITVHRPPWDGGRNESKSSSSTRSYISIPPTSPSENYIEAGSDYTYMPSERRPPMTKMAWLTKNMKADAKNELSSYQASSGTQTDGDSSVKGPNCKTVFGTPWQFGGTFTSRGGVMQAKDSDVCLVVVPNAVPKGEYVDIYGAVFTDTTEIRKKLHFSANESLITPVVEYYAVPAHPFNRQVCVQLPHALPEEFDTSLIRVYTFTVDEHGKVSLYNVPMSSKANDDRDTGANWEKGTDGHSIHISTIHFSGYFCTQCETTSWPSICTMVFGSHVQITQSRREIRVILYIWDRRLTIKDYFERFRKQESDVDRQLLTDMQVPLLDNASSDSRLVMCMEVMGGDDERQSWRHILRPDGSRLLFKPLQMRKLSEIVHCCRQTDPIRVEWALENVPEQIPSAVFQCCIDIMHVHESTRDYETAMREGSDDLMRTFYVRDLKVMTNSAQLEPKPSGDFQRVDLKRTLSETMDLAQTERMCQEFGISIKDIGNFRKKYSTLEEFQLGLVEECLKRHGPDTFLNLLPKILERLHYTAVLAALDDRKILARQLTDFTGLTDASAKENVPQSFESLGGNEDNTTQKSPYRMGSTSPDERNRPSLPLVTGKSKEYSKPDLQQKVLGRSGNVFVHDNTHHRNLAEEEQHTKEWAKESNQSKGHKRDRQHSPPNDYSGEEEDHSVNSRNIRYSTHRYTDQNFEERQPLKNQKSSSRGDDSVLGSSSEPSKGNASSHFTSKSAIGTSMFAHADPKDFAEPLSDEFLDDSEKQTYRKELAISKILHGHYSSEEYAPFQNVSDGHYVSDSGPYAVPPDSGQGYPSSLSDPVPPYHILASNQRLCEKSQSPDKDQTLKKELYGINTVV